MWKVVTSSNNNLLLKIYCKNINKYCGSIFQLRFLIFYIIFLPFISFSSLHVSFLFFFFLLLVFLLHTGVQPPFFYFLFHLKNIPASQICFTWERERELVRRAIAIGDRGHRKDKAGGDQCSPCSTTMSATPPLLVVLPTTKLGQIGLFFFFFFFHICLF